MKSGIFPDAENEIMFDYKKEQEQENMLSEMKRIGWETKLDDK